MVSILSGRYNNLISAYLTEPLILLSAGVFGPKEII